MPDMDEPADIVSICRAPHMQGAGYAGVLVVLQVPGNAAAAAPVNVYAGFIPRFQMRWRFWMEIDVDIDKKRKQFFFNLCSIIIVIAFTILFFIDCYENDTIEVCIDLVVILTLLISLYLRKKFDKDMMIYRIIVTIMYFLYLYSVHMGSGNETVLYWAYIDGTVKSHAAILR